MVDTRHISLRLFTPAARSERDSGLLGWVTLDIGGLIVVQGISLRRTRASRLALSYPERRDSAGRRHPLIRPVDDDVRKAIEAAVLADLALKGVIP